MPRRREEPPSGRRRRSREPARRFLAVCGGRVTEPGYLEFVKADLSLASLDILPKGDADPLSVVRAAAKARDNEAREARKEHSVPYAEVWAIVDADEFADLDKANAEARAKGVKLVVSNPCFEVWLIDHIKPCPPLCSCTKDCEKLAADLGVVQGTDHARRGLSRAKAINEKRLRGQVESGISNAASHNTEEKRRVRTFSPNATSKYAVWTDMPEVVQSLIDESRRTK